MVISLILALCAIVAIGERFGIKPGFQIRFLRTAVQIPRHRAKLTAMCPVMPFLEPSVAKALPIHINTWGETGPNVLLIHGGVQGGLGGGPATFRDQQALAASGWQLLVADRPGFGLSPSRGPDDMEADAEWVAAHLGTSAHLIGHSFGGAVSLLAAARQPSLVRSLILIEPALIPLVIGSKEMNANTTAREDFLRMIQSWVSTRTPFEYARTLMQNLGVAPEAPGAAVHGEKQLDEKMGAEVGCSFLQARMASRGSMQKAAQAVAKAGIPVLIVTGGWSPTFEVVGKVVAQLTGGVHLTVNSPDHFVQMTAAKEFNQKVDEFMRAAEAKNGGINNTAVSFSSAAKAI